MNEAMAAAAWSVAAWSVGCTCSDLQARVSPRLDLIQGVGTPEPGTSGSGQCRTKALCPHPLPSPCFMSWAPGKNNSPSDIL